MSLTANGVGIRPYRDWTIPILLDGSLKAINNSKKAADSGGDGSNGFMLDAFGMVWIITPMTTGTAGAVL